MEAIVTRRRGRRLPKTLDAEQFELLLRELSPTSPTGARNRAVLLMMWEAGLRVGEVCALAPADVNRRERKVTVRHGKGDRDREVPLTDRALTAVQAWEGMRGSGGRH